MEWLIGIAKDAMVGKISPETIALAIKAQNYDADVAAAVEEGEIAGRNARIMENLRKSKKGDGTSPLNGKNGSAGVGRKSKSMFDLANEAM